MDLPVFERLEDEVLHKVRGLFEPHHASKTPAPTGTMKPATQQEETMSLATFEQDLGQRAAAFEAAVRAELGKVFADVPAVVGEARAFATTPLGQLAVTAAGHLAAGVIPPEALAIVESEAASIYGKILSLYQPQGGQPQQQPAQAPAQ